MTTRIMVSDRIEAAGESRRDVLYRLGGIAALMMVALTVLDILVSMTLPGGDSVPGTLTAVEWFDVFASNTFQGLRDLGILNILNGMLGIPVFLALYTAHRHTQRSYAGLALILFVFGQAIYISNNTVLPMLALSQDYANAVTETHRAALTAAGEAMLARGADFTPGSMVGFVLPSVASILMAWVLLRGGIFGKVTGYAGLIGFSALLVFAVWITCSPASFDTAMLLALPGGLLTLVWNISIARRFFNLE